jgi:hypothetical protein
MFEHIKKRFPFPKEKWRKFLGSFERMEVPAKTLLLKEDEVSYNAYYVSRGLAVNETNIGTFFEPPNRVVSISTNISSRLLVRLFPQSAGPRDFRGDRRRPPKPQNSFH